MMTLPRNDRDLSDGSETGPYSGLSDRDCAILAKAGNPEARTALVDRHLGTVYRLCLRLLRDKNDAADATQEVFFRAFHALDSFDAERSLRSWLAAIAWNYVRDLGRRARHRRTVPISFDGPEPVDRKSESPFEKAAEREQSAIIEEALDRLEPQARTILVLREMEGPSYEELADLLDCQLGTIKSRIHRARLELRTVLLARHRAWLEE
jgi:RNA polymerase sigma-70 factor (ECF subfamily)